jgi:hypothetical protein
MSCSNVHHHKLAVRQLPCGTLHNCYLAIQPILHGRAKVQRISMSWLQLCNMHNPRCSVLPCHNICGIAQVPRMLCTQVSSCQLPPVAVYSAAADVPPPPPLCRHAVWHP